MSLKLNKTIADFLKHHPEQKFTARQIAEWIFATYPEECREKQRRSTATAFPLDSDAALIQQIVAEIGAHRPRLLKTFPIIKTTEGRPRKYYYTRQSDQAEVEQAEAGIGALTVAAGPDDGRVLKEYALYPLLSEFLKSELGVYSKRIDEKRSQNKRGPNGNKWLYPDIVGMLDLSAEWCQEVKACVTEYGDKKTTLWSFEVKVLVNRANVREVFFQTVSNSAWANLGYLVAGEIQGTDTMKELRILSGLHGIGVMELDMVNPSESQILIPARERDEVDWNTVNRLAEENGDFLEFVRVVRRVYQTGEVRGGDWEG